MVEALFVLSSLLMTRLWGVAVKQGMKWLWQSNARVRVFPGMQGYSIVIQWVSRREPSTNWKHILSNNNACEAMISRIQSS